MSRKYKSGLSYSGPPPEQCPACGSKRMAMILYGSVTEDAQKQILAEGQFVLGGKLRRGFNDVPSWECQDC
jgi:hypothetical protein